MPVNLETFKNIPDDAIDGDKIHGGTISSFSSTGIADLASRTALTVSDGRITVEAVRTSTLEGNIRVDGSLAVKKHIAVQDNSHFEQDVYVGKDLTVAGEIRAITMRVDNVIAKTSYELKEPVNWSFDNGGIEGKGLVFKRSKKEVDIFIYKSDPARMYTNLDIELYRANSFRIDGTPVLSVDTLGPSITKSSLRKVGRLQDLTVTGDTIIGEHVFYDSKSNRLGIGTDKPHACVGIVDSGIEIVLGSLYEGVGNIGTITGHDLGIITDGVQRVKFSRTGKIEFGDAKANNADVLIHGKLYVKELIVDQKNENGNRINSGKISEFSSTGITDLATKSSLIVTDGRIAVDALSTSIIEGDITLDGSIEFKKNITVKESSIFDQDLFVGKDLVVSGEIRAVTMRVDNLITKTTIDLKDPVNWSVDNGGIEGKGLVFKRSEKEVDIFIYKSDPARMYTNLDIDLYKDNSFRIDGTLVLNIDSLGPGITKSNLHKVGRLQELQVSGNVILGDCVFLDATSGRLGIGTDKASAAFSLVDKGIEIVAGSLYENTGSFGTFTNHDFSIVTNNIQRVKFSHSGKIEFGDSESNNADVLVHGKLYVKELIVDQRQEKTAPLEFKALKGATNYGRGMIFTGQGITKQFIFAADPDQFFSTEHINLAADRGYLINGQKVLKETEIGPSVTKSYLTEVGTLSYLKVDGETNLGNVFLVKDDKVFIGNVEISTKDGVKISGNSFEFKAENQSITLSEDKIVLGNKDRPVVKTIINGTLAVGMQSVGDNAQLEVAGNIRFSNRLFITGAKAPTTGTYRKGDIVWNDEPRETGYVGWVCVREGNPGIWRGFGQIGIE